MPGRKWQQIRAFASRLQFSEPPRHWLDWCSGKGHLGRLLAQDGARLTCLEYDPALVEAGAALSQRQQLQARHIQQDVLAADAAQQLAPEHSPVALHACGDLHVRLLQLASQRGCAQGLLRLLEENLYWVMVYSRWFEEANWKIFRPVLLGGVPAPARLLVSVAARRGVRRQLVGHGIGLHSRDEIYAIGERDLNAVADVLGDQPYLMGQEATRIDAAAYGLLVDGTASAMDGAEGPLTITPTSAILHRLAEAEGDGPTCLPVTPGA